MKFSDLNLLDVGNSIQLAGAVYIGNGKMLLAMFPDESGEVCDSSGADEVVFYSRNGKIPVETLSLTQKEWETFVRQTDLLETQGLVKTQSGTVEKAILRKSQRQIEQGVSWKVFRRDGYKCRYCGADDLPLTVDHLVCWELGGPSIESNLVASCRKCNKTRGNLSYEDWLEHEFYKKVSKKLSPEVLADNLALKATLSSIPLHYHKRSR